MTHEEGDEVTGTNNEELVLEFITAGETAVTENSNCFVEGQDFRYKVT